MKFSKYFWDLNEKALLDTKKILKDPKHSKFNARMSTLLSRCQDPKELFSLISKERFIETWPKIRAYWKKITPKSDFRAWWETIYEGLLNEFKLKEKSPKGESAEYFVKVGKLTKQARIEKGWSQKELSLRVGIKQPDISKIEEGKKNITLKTLAHLCKVLGIKEIML